MQTERSRDAVASVTLAVVSLGCLALSYVTPWWVMRASAPQYGQRTLMVEVGPRGFDGDIFELDTLGHYVGIMPMRELAKAERAMAPLGIAVAAVGVVLLPFLSRRWLRLLVALAVAVVPVVFVFVLGHWVQKSVDERDPDAALNLSIGAIDTKLFQSYEVGQFRVSPAAGEGLRLSTLAGVMAVGLAFARPLRLSSRARKGAASGAVAASFLVAFSARAERYMVGPSETLTAALEAAQEGDELVIPPRVFQERLVVEKQLRLVAPRGAVIDGGGQGTVVRVRAAGVRLEGLTLRASGDDYTGEDAAVRIEAPRVVLSGVRMEDTLFGVFALEAHGCVVERSTIVGKDLPVPRRGDGIRLWSSNDCRLTGNAVERSRDVVIWYSSGTRVEDNTVRHSRYGLHYMYSDDNVFRRNRFEHNEVGAAIMYSKRVRLEENAFSFSAGPSAHGLLLKDADDVFIVRNRFEANASALFFDGAPQSRGAKVEVRGNWVAKNDVGVVLQPSSRGIHFWENAFVGNRAQVQVQGEATSVEANHWSVGGVGNHWSDAVVYDADRDGVSELPYRVESTYEAISERYPVLAFFAGSPAAEAIDSAARLFPVFAPRPRMEDSHPLVRPPADAVTAERTPSPRMAMAGALMLLVGGLGALGAQRSSS